MVSSSSGGRTRKAVGRLALVSSVTTTAVTFWMRRSLPSSSNLQAMIARILGNQSDGRSSALAG